MIWQTENKKQRSKTGKDHKRKTVFTVDMYLPQWSTKSEAKKPQEWNDTSNDSMLKNFDPLQKKSISLSFSPEFQNKHPITSIVLTQ